MAEFPTYEQMAKNVAEKALDEFLYDGKSIREWMKIIAEQPIGHWIILDDCEKFIAKCSECGQIEDSRMIGKYQYCHCGARMEGEQDG